MLSRHCRLERVHAALQKAVNKDRSLCLDGILESLARSDAESQHAPESQVDPAQVLFF